MRVVKPTAGLSRETRKQAIEEMLYANDVYWHDEAKVSFDPRQVAWVASDVIERNQPRALAATARSEEVKVTYPSPQQVVLDVELESPGLVILADVIYPGWQLTIDGKPAPIYRVNGLMRGALVPASATARLHVRAPIVLRRTRRLGDGPGALAVRLLLQAMAGRAAPDQGLACLRPAWGKR